MGLLAFLWCLSLVMAGVALVGASILLVCRPGREWRDRQVSQARSGILQVVLDPLLSEKQLRRHVARAARLATLPQVILEVLGLIRGSARISFIERLTRAEAAERLRLQIRHGTPRDRRYAIEALAAFAPAESEAALQAAWWDHDLVVRYSAMRASLDNGSPPAFSDVLQKANSVQGRELVLALGLTRLMAARFPRAACIALTESDLSAPTRVALIEGVATKPEATSFEALATASWDPQPSVRAAAVMAIGNWPGPVSLAIVLRAFADSHWPVRAAAALISGKARLVATQAALQMMTTDPHWWVRVRASEALQQLEDTKRLAGVG